MITFRYRDVTPFILPTHGAGVRSSPAGPSGSVRRGSRTVPWRGATGSGRGSAGASEGPTGVSVTRSRGPVSADDSTADPTHADGRRPWWSPPVGGSSGVLWYLSVLVRASSFGLGRLHVDGQLLQLGLVGPGVVPAEEQFSTGGQYCADLGRCTAAVTSVRGGEFRPGQSSGHRHLPPSRLRIEVRAGMLRSCDRRLSTVADAGRDRSCSRRALSSVTYRSSVVDDRCYGAGRWITRW